MVGFFVGSKMGSMEEMPLTLYDTMGSHINLLDWELEQDSNGKADSDESVRSIWGENEFSIDGTVWSGPNIDSLTKKPCAKREQSFGSFKHRVIDSMQAALSQAENDFLYMVEQEMDDRPDLVSIGSCVLVVLLYGKDLYILNLGDSRAVLATYGEGGCMKESKQLQTVQLTDSHTVENESERAQLVILRLLFLGE